MRTTLSIDDSLPGSAKSRASERHLSLGRYVEEVIRRDLATAAPALKHVSLPASGSGGFRPGINPGSNASLFAALDDRPHVE
ncbi:MAG: hypothetical protein LBJ02_08405 [Bifidobacteriaceae bacterium]|nr:hypothetical protein [Bifidobacteriaceae bacterium]